VSVLRITLVAGLSILIQFDYLISAQALLFCRLFDGGLGRCLGAISVCFSSDKGVCIVVYAVCLLLIDDQLNCCGCGYDLVLAGKY
jgi:hypothetical protein